MTTVLAPNLPRCTVLDEELTIPHQRTHVGDTRPLSERDRLSGRSGVHTAKAIGISIRMAVPCVQRRARLDVLPARGRLASETALVNLQVDRRDETHVGQNTVTGGEGDDVPRDKFIGEDV